MIYPSPRVYCLIHNAAAEDLLFCKLVPGPSRRVLLCVAVVNCNQATLFCDQWLCQFDCQYVVLPSAASLQTEGYLWTVRAEQIENFKDT